jgi:hypothetical protein
MDVRTAPGKAPSSEELDERRLAVENAIGTLRIEKLELEPQERQIFDRFAQGEISLDEMDSLVEQMTATIR